MVTVAGPTNCVPSRIVARRFNRRRARSAAARAPHLLARRGRVKKLYKRPILSQKARTAVRQWRRSVAASRFPFAAVNSHAPRLIFFMKVYAVQNAMARSLERRTPRRRNAFIGRPAFRVGILSLARARRPRFMDFTKLLRARSSRSRRAAARALLLLNGIKFAAARFLRRDRSLRAGLSAWSTIFRVYYAARLPGAAPRAPRQSARRFLDLSRRLRRALFRPRSRTADRPRRLSTCSYAVLASGDPLVRRV